MALRFSILEHYKLEAETFSRHTVHIRKVRRVEERERWDHVEKIGWGSSGVVWLQEKTSKVEGHKEQRAVKVLEKGRMKQMGIDYMKELEALTEFRMPKILQEDVLVNFYGWFENKDKVFLAMEYFVLGDLERYITSNSITEQDTKDITVDLLKAVKLMHAEDFTHRDIKPKNILVLQNSPKWFVKLGDFGITKRTSSAATALRTNTGTPLYSAPEIGFYGEDEDDVYTKAVDLWSVGCVVYHILAQRAPFETAQAKKKPFPRDRLVGRASGDVINFLSSLLALDPAGRPAAAEALEHPWLVNVHPAESASGQIIESEMSTQLSLQSLGKQDSEGMLTRLLTDVRPRSNTEKWRGMPHSQSPLRSGGDDGLLVETQEHSSPSVTQPESYRRRTQYIMDQSNAGSDAATEKQPPSSQIDRPRHTSKGQQRAASSALPPPETFGIQTEPSVVINATESVSTHRAPTAPALFDERGISTPKSSSSSAASSFSRIALGEELRKASEKCNIDGVQGLVRDGADVESIDPNDLRRLTAMHYVSAYNHNYITKFLLDSGANIRAHDANNSNPLYSAASESHNNVTRLFLHRGAVVDVEGKNGYTSLHEAAAKGHVSVARELLEYGADINMQESAGWTALHIAARRLATRRDFNIHIDTVGIMLATEANVNAQNSKGSTALYIAACNDHKDIVNLLLAANANINVQDVEGWTALHIAAWNRCIDIVGLLLAADADINVQNIEGCTALYLAAQLNCKETVGLLLAADADINVQKSGGWTALYIAAEKNHKDIVSMLLTADADINVQESGGWTALHIAAEKNHKDIVSMLLTADADINVQDSGGWTALHIAAEENHKDIVSMLLAAGANVNLDTESGMTALRIATHMGHVEVVEALLQTDINVWARDSSGKTALDVAKEEGQKEVIFLLAGARGIGKMAWITAQVKAQKLIRKERRDEQDEKNRRSLLRIDAHERVDS